MSRRTRSNSSLTGGRWSRLARRRADVLCLSGDLTKQTEVDLFQAELR